MSTSNQTAASSTPAAGSNPDDLKENLWQQMLSKATNTSSSQDSTLVVLGDKRCGKSKMLLKFKERSVNDKSQDYLLDYSYTHVKNVRDDAPEDTVAYMDIWEINSEEHAGNVLPVLLKTHGLRNACYVIALDLSQPWNLLTSLTKWIGVLTKAHETAMSSMSPAQQEEMRLAISSYNQFFVDYSIQAEEAKAAAPKVVPPDDLKLSVMPDVPKINLGVPLIVVGCKADTVAQVFSQQVGVGDRFEYMSRHLRKFCLDYGASLVFTSSVGQAGTGIETLQEYIYHRLYKFELVHPAKPVGSETDFGIRVWSGFDSNDLINSIQPAKAAWGDDAPFQEVFKDPTQAKVAAAMKHDPEIKTEDNDIFFKKLKFDMEKGNTRVRTRINLKDSAIAEAANPIERGPSDKASAAIPLPTPAPAAAPSPTAPANTAATASAAAAASTSKTPMKGDQRAVKDFFRSLLTSAPGAAKPIQAVGKDALEQLKADK